MREGWEIKKLGEVAAFYNGYTPKMSTLLEQGDIPYFKVSDMNHPRNTKYLTHTLLFLESGCKIFPKNTIVYPKNGAAIATNKKRILGQDSVVDLNTGGIYPNDKIVECEFLYLFLLNIDFRLLTRRGAVPTLDIVKLKNSYIPVPPLSEQERIVAELDMLNGVIEKKREQLTQLDALAQSIFYDMFGDPITNEKGWEICLLKNVAKIVGGSTPKTNIEEYWNGNKYWVTPAELHGTRYISATERCITDKAVKETHLTLLPPGTVLLSSRAPIGKVCITRVPMYCNQGFKNIICSERLHNEYVYQYFLDKAESLNSLGSGATFKEISKAVTEKIPIPVPPLSLQRRFAEKIEAIEQQKERICQSLAEVQQLFDSRMDYYFNEWAE